MISHLKKVLVILFISLNYFASAQNIDSMMQNPAVFIRVAGDQLAWEKPTEPLHIVGPIYYVGTKGLSSYLITTTAGNILLNTGMPSSGPMIEASIRKLGFKPEDIKIILTGHAHVDHVGGHAYMKKISGAKIVIMAAEKELIESGGKKDFHYGTNKEFWFAPVKVDQIIHTGDSVKLGNITMKAISVAGHTKGTTAWMTTVTDNNKSYKILFADGTGINPGYRLEVKPSYPGISENYKRTFATLESLKADIWLSPHPEQFDFETKRKLAETKGPAAFIDPEGYKKYVENARKKYAQTVEKEKAQAATMSIK